MDTKLLRDQVLNLNHLKPPYWTDVEKKCIFENDFYSSKRFIMKNVYKFIKTDEPL